ncbi:MAG: SPL family radical SAM protein [Chloroflexota bacterium]
MPTESAAGFRCSGSCAYCDHREHTRTGTRGHAPLFGCCRQTESELVLGQGSQPAVGIIAPAEGTDPYDPTEEQCRQTRRRLEALLDHGLSALVVTRSDRVLRDLPLLERIAHAGSATVLMRVPTMAPEMSGLWEPDGPEPEQRLSALRPLSEAGVQAGLLASPLVPFLMDGHPQLRALLTAAGQAGARFFLLEPMAVDTGPEGDRARRLLAERWPHLLEPWQRLYAEAPHPPRAYAEKVAADAHRIGVELGLSHGMPRSWSPGALLHAAFAERIGAHADR